MPQTFIARSGEQHRAVGLDQLAYQLVDRFAVDRLDVFTDRSPGSPSASKYQVEEERIDAVDLLPRVVRIDQVVLEPKLAVELVRLDAPKAARLPGRHQMPGKLIVDRRVVRVGDHNQVLSRGFGPNGCPERGQAEAEHLAEGSARPADVGVRHGRVGLDEALRGDVRKRPGHIHEEELEVSAGRPEPGRGRNQHRLVQLGSVLRGPGGDETASRQADDRHPIAQAGANVDDLVAERS
jgi:hypothetical protein